MASRSRSWVSSKCLTKQPGHCSEAAMEHFINTDLSSSSVKGAVKGGFMNTRAALKSCPLACWQGSASFRCLGMFQKQFWCPDRFYLSRHLHASFFGLIQVNSDHLKGTSRTARHFNIRCDRDSIKFLKGQENQEQKLMKKKRFKKFSLTSSQLKCLLLVGFLLRKSFWTGKEEHK